MSLNDFNASLTSLQNGTGLLSVSGNSVPPSTLDLAVATQTTSAAGVDDYEADRQLWKIFLLIGIGFISCLAMVYVAIKIYLCTRSSKKKDNTAEDTFKVLIGVNYLYNRAIAGVAYVPDAQHKEPDAIIANKGATKNMEAKKTDEKGEKNKNQSANPEPTSTSTRTLKRANRARRSRHGRDLPLLHRAHADQADVVFKGNVVRVPLVKVNPSHRRPLPQPPPANMAHVRKATLF